MGHPEDDDRWIVFRVLFVKGRISLSNFVGTRSKIEVVGLEDEMIKDV